MHQSICSISKFLRLHLNLPLNHWEKKNPRMIMHSTAVVWFFSYLITHSTTFHSVNHPTQFYPFFLPIHRFILFLCKLALQKLLLLLTYLSWTSYFIHFIYNQMKHLLIWQLKALIKNIKTKLEEYHLTRFVFPLLYVYLITGFIFTVKFDNF